MTDVMRKPLRIFLLLLPGILCMASHAATVHLVTPQATPSPPVQRGMNALESLLASQGHSVLRSQGSLPQVNAALEIIISPFDPQALPAETRQALEEVVSEAPGAFTILKIPRESGLRVYAVGSDDVGAMYSAYDLVEQLRHSAAMSEFNGRIQERRESPVIPVRGLKQVIHDTVLKNPFSWFHSETHWQQFLDEMAHARFNLLELAGIQGSTHETASALWPRFALPAGSSNASIEQNRASLQRILELASERGIFVCLTSLPDAESQEGYSADAIKSIWREFSPIESIGYQLSGDSEGSANRIMSIIEAHQETPSPPLFLFSTTNPTTAGVEAIAERYRGRTVAKVPMNSFRFGLDYLYPGHDDGDIQVFLNYLNPQRSYGVLFDIQAAPMHAVFPWGNHNHVKQILSQTTVGNANGFVLDLATPVMLNSGTSAPWYMISLWGRLAYNPAWTETEWQKQFVHRFGPDAGPHMLEALQHASHVIPAIQSSRTPESIARFALAQLSPPPGISTLLNDTPADRLTLLSPMEEVRQWTDNIRQGREGAVARLQDAVTHIEEAIESLEQAGTFLDPEQQQPIGLIEDQTRTRFEEWQAWMRDGQSLKHLASSWLNSINAAVQYAIYLETGDIPSLILASESLREGYADWNRLMESTESRPPITLHHQPSSPIHWQTQPTSFEADLRLVTNAFTAWQSSTTWSGRVGHFPLLHSLPGQSILLTISIPPQLSTDQLLAMYRNSQGLTSQQTMKPTRIDGVYFAEIQGPEAIEGRLEYFFVGLIDGNEFSGRVAMNNRPFSISISSDTEGPRIMDLQHSVQGSDAVITADAVDPSGVSEVALVWKQVGAGHEWNRSQMQQGETGYRARISLSPIGTVYAIEATDAFGYTTRFPAAGSIPYRLIDASRNP